jgi:hypothetical protein
METQKYLTRIVKLLTLDSYHTLHYIQRLGRTSQRMLFAIVI